MNPDNFQAARLLDVQDLHKWYRSGRDSWAKAVDGVTFSIRAGETVALVGESGCGKTTTARLIMRLLNPQHGSIKFEGMPVQDLKSADLQAYRRQVQMVFQDPYDSLNPRRTIRDILREPFVVHGLPADDDALERLLDRVGLRPGRQFLRRYPHQFSGGQRQRIGIARALALGPRLIVADEAVSSLDVSIRGQILNLLRDIQDEDGLSYLFITHDLGVVRSFCDRVLVMYLGRIVEDGPVEKVFRRPEHPYTRALLSAIPRFRPTDRASREILAGDVPSPSHIPSGCRFHPRCAYALLPRCRDEDQQLSSVEEQHAVACWRAVAQELPVALDTTSSPSALAVEQRAD